MQPDSYEDGLKAVEESENSLHSREAPRNDHEPTSEEEEDVCDNMMEENVGSNFIEHSGIVNSRSPEESIKLQAERKAFQKLRKVGAFPFLQLKRELKTISHGRRRLAQETSSALSPEQRTDTRDTNLNETPVLKERHPLPSEQWEEGNTATCHTTEDLEDEEGELLDNTSSSGSDSEVRILLRQGH